MTNDNLAHEKKTLTIKAQVLAALAIVSITALGISTLLTASTVTQETQSLSKTTIISAGQNTSQVVTTSGERFSRGLNNYGQLGVANYDENRNWELSAGESFAAISSEYTHSLALTEAGKLFSWGTNNARQLGVDSASSLSAPAEVSVAYKFSQVSSGTDFTVALDQSGNIWSWGANGSGQLGNGNTTSVETPQLITTPVRFTSVKAGKNYVVALDVNKKIWTWGVNASGQLGNGNNDAQNVPVQISDKNWDFINTNVSSETTVAIDDNDNLFTWGLNDSGQLGVGVDWRQQQADENARVAREIKAIQDADKVRRDALVVTCETNRKDIEDDIKEANKNVPTSTPTPSNTPRPTDTPVPTQTPLPVYDQTCSEEVDANFVPTDTSKIVAAVITEPALAGNSNVPVQVTSNQDFIYAAVGSQNAFAINKNDRLYGWGLDKNGQTGLGLTDDVSHTQVPVLSANTDTFVQVDVGVGFAAAVTRDNELTTWGLNESSSLGTTEATITSPKIIQKNINSVSLGQKTGFATDTSGTIFSWGKGSDYLVGNGANTDLAVPTSINQPGYSIAVGATSVVALNQLGELIGWGNNVNKTLGNGSLAEVATPTRVMPTAFTAISTGNQFSLALDSNGLVWAWGSNALQQIGENGGETFSAAAMIPLSEKVKLIAAGENKSYAVTENNTIWYWGDTNARVTQLTNSEDIVQIDAGKNHLVALDNEGQVWNWGINTTAVNAEDSVDNTLVKIDSEDTFTFVTAGGEASLAIREDGAVVGWGNNDNHQLMNNDAIVVTPTIVTEQNTYKRISLSATHVLAIDENEVVYGWGNEPYGTFGLVVTPQENPFVLPVTNENTDGDN
jgi:alpha-tubulin suppressor-like RCC1 family protein